MNEETRLKILTKYAEMAQEEMTTVEESEKQENKLKAEIESLSGQLLDWQQHPTKYRVQIAEGQKRYKQLENELLNLGVSLVAGKQIETPHVRQGKIISTDNNRVEFYRGN